jgi:predicted nucleotidyltransferase
MAISAILTAMSTVDRLQDRIAAALNAGPPLRLAMIFGSTARGTNRPDSDVDIAILPSDPDLPLTAELDLQRGLTAACGRPVDIVRLDRASSLVRWQVARDGRPLFQAGPFEAARFVAQAASEYLDFQPDFERASALFQKRLADGAMKS